MGWEKRGNGWYYYRKKRVGRRVVSEYIGRGKYAEAIAKWDKLDRMSRKLDRQSKGEEFERMRQEAEAIDAILNEIEDTIRLVTRAYLAANGFHTHKGQWRKKDND